MNRRQKERRQAKRGSAPDWAERDADDWHHPFSPSQVSENFSEEDEEDRQEADPSEFGVRWLSDLTDAEKAAGAPLYCRESSKRQKLDDQCKGSRRFLRDHGVKCVRTFSDVGDGNSLDPGERPGLFRAIEYVKRTGKVLTVPV